jgi:predicted DNA-binding protein
MATIKTAVSIERDLFERVERAADELGMSRSGFLAAAAERYLKDLDDIAFQRRVNASYQDPMDEEDWDVINANLADMAALPDEEWE